MRTLYTNRLILRDFVHSDAPEIAAALNDMETCRGLTMVPCPYTMADAEAFLAKPDKDARAVCTLDDQLIGVVGNGAQFGYWFAKAQWGKGYASEATQAVVADHFAHSDADLLSGYVSDNHASAAVLRKLGFEITGDKMLHIRSRNKEVPSKSVVLTKSRWETMT